MNHFGVIPTPPGGVIARDAAPPGAAPEGVCGACRQPIEGVPIRMPHPLAPSVHQDYHPRHLPLRSDGERIDTLHELLTTTVDRLNQARVRLADQSRVAPAYRFVLVMPIFAPTPPQPVALGDTDIDDDAIADSHPPIDTACEGMIPVGHAERSVEIPFPPFLGLQLRLDGVARPAMVEQIGVDLETNRCSCVTRPFDLEVPVDAPGGETREQNNIRLERINQALEGLRAAGWSVATLDDPPTAVDSPIGTTAATVSADQDGTPLAHALDVANGEVLSLTDDRTLADAL